MQRSATQSPGRGRLRWGRLQSGAPQVCVRARARVCVCMSRCVCVCVCVTLSLLPRSLSPSYTTEKPSWCTLGYGTASKVADPKFRNARGGDFGLQPGSPAINMGFVPLPPGLDRC